jgi:U3 small nucleolar RNA-associated protein 4
VRFNPHKSEIAVSREDSSIEIWSQNPYFHCRKIIPAHSATAQAARRMVWVSESRLISAGWNGELTEWNLSSLSPRASSASFGGPVWDLAVSQGGGLIAVACEDGGLRLFDTTDELVFRRSLSTGSARVLCCAFSQVRKDHVVTGDAKGRLQVWDYALGKQVLKISVSGAKVQSPVWAVACLADGAIVTGDSIGYTQIWDATFGNLLHSFKTHESSILCFVCTSTSIFASGVDSNIVRIDKSASGEWFVSQSNRPNLHDIHSLEIAGSTLVSACLDGSLALHGLDSFSKKKAKLLRPFPAFHSPIVSVSLPARIVCCKHSHSVQLYRLGKAAASPTDPGVKSGTKLHVARPHVPLVEIKPDVALPLHFAELSQNGEVVLMGNREGLRGYSVEVGLAEGGQVKVARLDLPDHLSRLAATRVCFSAPAENVFAVATFVGEIVIVSLVDFAQVCAIAFHKKRFVSGLAIKQQLLVSMDDQRNVALHRTDSGECVFALPQFELVVTALSFHPTSPWLLIASLSDQIFVFDYVKKQHTPWSVKVGDKMDTKLDGGEKKNFRTCVLGFAFGPKIMYWGNNYINALDVADVRATKIQRIDRYSDVIALTNLSANELVVVERSWKTVIKEMPAPLLRHRYVL